MVASDRLAPLAARPRNGAHRSPSDVAFLGEALGRQAQPLSGTRCVEIVREYVAAFADQHLRHRQPVTA